MSKTKKAKSGKKKVVKSSKKEVKEIPTTTHYIRKEREICTCPRLGDAHHRSDRVEDIKSDIALIEIRKAIELELDTLDLKGYSLCNLPHSFVKSDVLPINVIHLNLSKNALFRCERVLADIFRLSKLKTLNLSKNHITGKLTEHIKNFTELEEIYLDQNHISDIHSNCEYWKSLKIFSASHNEFKSLPDSVGEWPCLKTCNIQYNRLEALPETIYKWNNLKKLYVGNNKLKAIPDKMGDIVSLKEMDIKNNLLEMIPATLEKCTELVYFNAGNNKITQLPHIEHWTKMQDLQLYRNHLRQVPSGIKNLTQIRRLSISNNKIKTLPTEFGELENLEELYINYNSLLATLPPSIGNLKSLRELSLRGCASVKSLPTSLGNCTQLAELDIRTLTKKESCKFQPELLVELTQRRCKIRGGVQKKAKKKGKSRKKTTK